MLVWYKGLFFLEALGLYDRVGTRNGRPIYRKLNDPTIILSHLDHGWRVAQILPIQNPPSRDPPRQFQEIQNPTIRDPPRQRPEIQNPPIRDPPKRLPEIQNPPRRLPGIQNPPSRNPPRRLPEIQNPPHRFQPRQHSRIQNPPIQNPPSRNPPRRNPPKSSRRNLLFENPPSQNPTAKIHPPNSTRTLRQFLPRKNPAQSFSDQDKIHPTTVQSSFHAYPILWHSSTDLCPDQDSWVKWWMNYNSHEPTPYTNSDVFTMNGDPPDAWDFTEE